MSYTIAITLIGVGMFVGMTVLIEFGRRVGCRRIARDPEWARNGLGAIDGAVFALLGLLIAFTFSSAAERFDIRRSWIVEEVNAIGTAYLRLELLSTDAQPPLREAFRRYLDSRITTYQKLPDIDAAMAELARSQAIQKEIWTRSVAASQSENRPSAAMLLLPALNQMIDITTTRTVAAKMHPPTIVFVLLVGLALACSFLAGHGMAGSKARSWTHTIAFAAVMTITVFVILDVEYPRLGLIRVDACDQAFVDLRQSMD